MNVKHNNSKLASNLEGLILWPFKGQFRDLEKIETRKKEYCFRAKKNAKDSLSGEGATC